MPAGREARAALASEERFLQPGCHLRPAQRSPGQVTAHRAAVQLGDSIRPEAGPHLALNPRQVYAQHGEQVGSVPARPVAASRGDDAAPHGPRSRQADAVVRQDVPSGRVLVSEQREEQVLATDVAVAGTVPLLAGSGHQPGTNRVPARPGAACHMTLRPGKRRLAYLRCTDCRVTPSASAIRSQVQPSSRAALTCNASSCSTICRNAATEARPTSGSRWLAASASEIASDMLSAYADKRFLSAQADKILRVG